MSKKNNSNQPQAKDFTIKPPVCDLVFVGGTGGPGDNSPAPCTGDDDGTPTCDRKCGCQNLPNPSGGAGDTAGDPSFSQAGGGGSPPDYRVGGDYKPVDLANGSTDVVSPSIGSLGPVARLSYSNRLLINGILNQIQAGCGTNWSLNLAGKISDRGEDEFLAFFLPGSRGEKYYFKEENGDFLPLYGSTAELFATTDEYELQVNGTKTIFYKPSGYLKQMISAGGLVTDFTYNSNSQLTEVVTKYTEGTSPNFTYMHNSLLFEYDGNDMLETITERSYVGTNASPSANDFVEQNRMVFEITSGSPVQNWYVAGSLHKIHVQSPTGSGWHTDASYMYIYYTESTEPTGFLKYVIEPAGFASLGVSDPDYTNTTQQELADAASVYFEYTDDDKYRISQVDTKGGSESVTITYDDNDNTNPAPDPDLPNHWIRKAVYTSNDGSVKTVYSNKHGSDLLVKDFDGTNTWLYYTEFDTIGRPIAYSPASITSYTENDNDLGVVTKPIPSMRRKDAGRIDLTDWYSTTGSGAALGRLESRSVKEGSSGTPVLLRKWEYTSHTVGTGGDARTIYPVSKEIQYTSDSGGGDPVTTEYTYTWHTDLNQDEIFQAKTITTKLPNVAATQNGVAHPQNDTIVNEYNLRGQLIKSTDARGMVTEYDYDQATGAMIQMIRDSGAGKLNLTTDYEVDNRGRVTRTLGPVHDVDGTDVRTASWTVHVDEHETWRGQGYHNPGTSTDTLVNPVQIERRSADGTTVDRITATRGSTVESSGALADTDTLSEDVAWTRQIYDIFGRMTASRVYHAIPTSGDGTAGTNYTETSYGYDAMGRQNRVATPDGTINRTVYNVRSLVVSTWVGTNDKGATDSDPTGGGATGNNMVQLTAVQYDNNSGGKNGLRTKLTQLVNATSTDDRVSEFAYDWRNRLINTITTDGTDEFHQKPTLDNLGRATKNETFRDDSGTLTLIAKSEQFFDDRGRQYRSKTYAVSNSGVAGNALESNQWFDANGQTIKSESPGSTAFTKTVYDAVGRATTVYSAYYAGVGSDDPESITNNVVLTESHSEYDDAGNLLMSTSQDRLHNATGDGALNGPAGSQPQSRDSYAATWYDEIGRSVASANYGTNVGTAPTRPDTVPTASDTILVSQTVYDINGRAFESVDPAGDMVRLEFDDAGRTTKTIHNFGGTDTQTIRTEYNAVGQMSKQIAENADTGNQETVYTYGVTLADSDLASNSLLAQVTDPESGTVSYDYDRTGQQISMTDANGNVHQYSYDEAGRRVTDKVTTLGTNVDGAVRRIEHSYDNRRRLEKVTSYDAVTAGNVQSEIQYQYNNFGQLTKEYQQHGAEVDTANSPAVEYAYAGGSANTIRMSSVTYPDGRQLDYQYGTSGSQTDLLDRVATIEDGATTLVSYQYSGAGMVVTQTYNQPGFAKTIALGSGSDPYSALDRFGRMIDLRWTKSTTNLVQLEYGYDRVSNRLV